MIQARSSYLPREIMWGNRFVNMLYYDKSQEVYRSDFDRFDELEVVSAFLIDILKILTKCYLIPSEFLEIEVEIVGTTLCMGKKCDLYANASFLTYY